LRRDRAPCAVQVKARIDYCERGETGSHVPSPRRDEERGLPGDLSELRRRPSRPTRRGDSPPARLGFQVRKGALSKNALSSASIHSKLAKECREGREGSISVCPAPGCSHTPPRPFARTPPTTTLTMSVDRTSGTFRRDSRRATKHRRPQALGFTELREGKESETLWPYEKQPLTG